MTRTRKGSGFEGGGGGGEHRRPREDLEQKKVDSKKSFLQWPWRHLASPLSKEGINIKSVNKISRAKIL